MNVHLIPKICSLRGPGIAKNTNLFSFCGDELGLGCDDKKIIEILAHRNYVQRQELRREYKIRYDKDLIDTLKSELHGKFEVGALNQLKSLIAQLS